MKRFFILFLLVSFSGCVEDSSTSTSADTSATVFEQDRWNAREGDDFPYRDEMLHDLMNSESIVDDRGLRELKRDEILELLGEPTRVDTNYLFYRVSQKRLGLWPLHTKTMVIQLAEDSTVNWVKIHE